MLGKLQRKEVKISGTYYNFDERFEEAMSWIDHTTHVIAINVLSRSDDGYDIKYEVIYRTEN